MSFPIPKLQWKNTSVSGTTVLGLNTVTGMTSTSSLEVGMIIEDAEFPTGTTITVVNANDIEVSNNATAGSVGVRIFYFEFDFRYPSSIDDGEKMLPKRRVKTAISGIDQVSIDHIRFERELEFGHLSESEIATLRDSFNKGHAMFGRDFRYFVDKTLGTYITYELDSADFEPKQLGNSDKKGIQMTFKRVEL